MLPEKFNHPPFHQDGSCCRPQRNKCYRRSLITHLSTRVIRVAQSLVFCVIYCEPWFMVSSIFLYDIQCIVDFILSISVLIAAYCCFLSLYFCPFLIATYCCFLSLYFCLDCHLLLFSFSLFLS